MDNQYFVVADTKILAAYAISILFGRWGPLFWKNKKGKKLWLPEGPLWVKNHEC
ncbi:MAG: hypothetical protein Ct9H300mP21_03500 [Pseudomonadota bacterium]|nr:MAG: hypothetical protein Ct9H300mP21_03500 [Pseudomonadota bacterium]